MLPITVLVIYLAACLWLVMSALRATSASESHGQHSAGMLMATLGWVLHGYLLCRSLFRGTALALNTADTASLIGWLIVAIALTRTWRHPRFSGIVGALLLCVGIAAAFTNDGTEFTAGQTGWQLTVHILVAVIAYSLIAVGAVLAVGLYALDRRLRSHHSLGWMQALPSVEALEVGMFQAVSLGFALLTLTLFSGFIFVQDLVAQHLAHKVALSCLAWLILGVLLLGRWRFGWRGRIAARWALSGFVLLVLAYFGSKLVLEVMLGKHWG